MRNYKLIIVSGIGYLLDLRAEIIGGDWFAKLDRDTINIVIKNATFGDVIHQCTSFNEHIGVYYHDHGSVGINSPYICYKIIASDNPELNLPYIKVATKNDLLLNAVGHLGHHIEADEIRYYRSDKEEGNALRQLSDAIERAMDDYASMTAPTGFSYEDLRYHCTRFAFMCRLKNIKINHETVDLFDNEYAPLLTQKEQYVNIATRVVLSPGWVPTYNNPDNHNLDPSAEPISVPLISYDNNNKPYITII